MTDTSHHAALTNGHDVKPASHRIVASPVDYARPGSNHADGEPEDDGAIHCICTFNEDDGNTVACDTCNRWQHIICYYPQYESLPEELDHWCVDCRPDRTFDRQAAYVRQKEARAQRRALQNGAKRQVNKSHKKKVKEPSVSGLTNGWPLDKHRHDRNSASPRDTAPPSKRPKTSHRASNSTTNALGNAPSRKTNGSTLSHHRSVSRSPDALIPLYTDEFINAYRDDDFRDAVANVCDIKILSEMNRWLNNRDEVIRITGGIPLEAIVQRWDGHISVLTDQSTLEIHEMNDPDYRTTDGQPACWKYATVSEPLAAQAVIGELCGHVQSKEDFKQEPTNRWASVQHPEPFVFFHPILPICIDARTEGTPVRYIRRSCKPNAELKIIITNSTEYHFCFIAKSDIDAGQEVSIAWDTGILQHLMDMVKRPSDRTTTKEFYTWCSTVLANCGPCACNSADCNMARFDRRGMVDFGDEPVKAPKPVSKKRKVGHHISPLNTHSVTSRSGSEARKAEQDDEPTDSRSGSGSIGRGSASRDITPSTHYSTNGTTEMSERERKKLAKVEELFHKQEEEVTGKQSKKKRSSAGSALNTPALTSSKQLSSSGPHSAKYADAGTSRQSGLASAKSTHGRRPKPSMAASSSRSLAKTAKAPKPAYVDSAVQCDMDEEETPRVSMPVRVRKPHLSMQQRLLERCARNNTSRRAQRTSDSRGRSTDSVMGVDEERQDPPNSSAEVRASLVPAHSSHGDDVTMEDALDESKADKAFTPERADPASPVKKESDIPDRPTDSPPAHRATNPPAPPWPGQAHQPAAGAVPESGDKLSSPVKGHPMAHSANMHISMPPPMSNPFATHSSHATPLMTPANNIIGHNVLQSPSTLTHANSFGAPPLFSPAVAAVVNPSPARKKLSLSDYTRRSKAKDRESESKADRESSPASVASGPAHPPLQTSSPELTRIKESGSAIEEDVRMEDAAA